jgi:cytochrome oxidase assembly protein ShyY1
VYRFLLTPRWLGLSALMLALAGAMVGLGTWQLHRYQERTAINAQIDAAGRVAPAQLRATLPPPRGPAGTAPPAPPAGAAWIRVTATGRYDREHELLARGRVIDGRVGYEVLTPLVLDDGAAVLVDRGWVSPAPGGATALPRVPAAPSGPVTVTGRVHLSESRAGVIDRREGRIEVRRISMRQLAPELPYPIYGAYVLLDSQEPPTEAGLEAIPVSHENSWQNGGYVAQWWIFALLTVAGLIWLIRREARTTAGFDAEVRELAAGDRGRPGSADRPSDGSTPDDIRDLDRRLPQAPVSPAV